MDKNKQQVPPLRYATAGMTKWLEGWDFWQTRQLSGPGGNKPRRKVFCGMGKTMNDHQVDDSRQQYLDKWNNENHQNGERICPA
jgi:hypothetical protein